MHLNMLATTFATARSMERLCCALESFSIGKLTTCERVGVGIAGSRSKNEKNKKKNAQESTSSYTSK